MAEYMDKKELDIAFTDKCTGDCGCCQYWNADSYEYDCKLIHNFPPADVVEREKIDKAIEKIENYTPCIEDENMRYAFECGMGKALEIIKRNIGESK